ncbi:hypothetical protein WOB83_08840, partial [Vibrio parahaemolyticus]
ASSIWLLFFLLEYETQFTLTALHWLNFNSDNYPARGGIGEFYAYRYLSIAFPDYELTYGSHSEKGWDIHISGVDLKVQVKTVSAYSKTRTISPLHKGWDILHIIYVNKALQPEGFWIIEDNSFFGNKSLLTSKKCRHPSNPNLLGSKDIPFGKNRIDELLQAL